MEPNTNPTPRTFASLGDQDMFTLEPAAHSHKCVKEGDRFRFYLGSYGRTESADPEMPVYNVQTEAERAAEYEAQREAERRKRCEAAATFRALCAKVCKAMGGDWKLEPLPKPNPNNPPMNDPREMSCATMVSGDRSVVLTHGSYKHGSDRIVIRGEVPRLADVTITVADTKEPAAIARDITRRVLPAYAEQLAKAAAKQKEEDDHKAAIAANLARMVKAGAQAMSHSPEQFYIAGNRGQVSRDSVRLELYGITLEQAERIVRMLAKG